MKLPSGDDGKQDKQPNVQQHNLYKLENNLSQYIFP